MKDDNIYFTCPHCGRTDALPCYQAIDERRMPNGLSLRSRHHGAYYEVYISTGEVLKCNICHEDIVFIAITAEDYESRS